MDGCGAVIHLAASADVGIVAEQPEEAERVNARGTLAVLEAARSTGIGRVVYGSTIWAYSDSGDGNGNGVIDEDTLLGLPKHLYTASKVAGEMYCTSYAELYDVPVHDPPLRHPVRAARPPLGGDPDLRAEGTRRRRADDRRRR